MDSNPRSPVRRIYANTEVKIGRVLRTPSSRAFFDGNKSRELISVERDCANYGRAAFLSDARTRTTKPPSVVGAKADISGFVTVIDRCAISRAGHPPTRPPGIAQLPG